MLFGENVRFWINIICGNVGFSIILYEFEILWAAIKDKESAFWVDVIFGIVCVIFWGALPREMDIPNIFASNYQTVEGSVEEFDPYRYKQAPAGWGRRLTIEEANTEEKRTFIQVYIPNSIEEGDLVEINYYRYSKMGIINKVNEKEFDYQGYRTPNHAVGIVIIVYLLTSMFLYCLKNFKLEAILNYRQDYSVHVYHNKFVKAIWGVYLIRVVTACVLILAIMGHYKNSFDCFWGILIILNYLGVFGLCFMNSKKFIIMRKRFYYADAHNRYEGDLEEIESVRETEDGLAITANGTEMKILCTAKKEQEKLCGKLHMKREVLA